MAVDQDEIEHFGLREHRDGAGCDLPAERLIRAEEQLLAGLATGVKSARNLRTAKRAIGEQAAIFSRKRDALLDALVDDRIGNLRESIDIRFPRAKIAALDRVIKEAKDAVAVVRVIFRGVDSALGCDAMGAARAVLVAERFDVVTLLRQRRRGRAAGQTGSDHNDLELATIVRRNQSGVVLMPAPFFRQRAMGHLRIERADHGCGCNFTRPRRTAVGMEL